MTTKMQYRSILERLPIENPTSLDMAMLCPHLTPAEAIPAFTTNSGYVGLPPLHVRHSFQIAAYRKETDPPRLDWAYAGRILRSQDDAFIVHKHMYEATQFAEDNWGDELILDDWKSIVEFIVQDPTDLINDSDHIDYPRTKAVLGVALSRDLNEINRDYSGPKSNILDESILQMTLDRLVWSEIKGGRGAFIRFNCAHCGAGLSTSYCKGCGHKFHDEGLRSGSNTPLSPKMVAFLLNAGHRFPVNPEIAWTKEKQYWEYASKRAS